MKKNDLDAARGMGFSVGVGCAIWLALACIGTAVWRFWPY